MGSRQPRTQINTHISEAESLEGIQTVAPWGWARPLAWPQVLERREGVASWSPAQAQGRWEAGSEQRPCHSLTHL